MTPEPGADVLARAAARFGGALRRAGVAAGPVRVQRYVEALEVLGPRSLADCYWAGRAVLISRPDDLGPYDAVFATVFGVPVPVSPTAAPAEVPVAIAVDDGRGDDDPADEPGDPGEVLAVRWSAAEVLRAKDFAAYTHAEHAEARRLMADLRLTGALRPSRRLVRSRRGALALRPTLAAAVRSGGEATVLHHRAPGRRPRRVVLLCDVSGSMEPYARALLRFLHSAVVGHGRVEAFTIGTRLTRVTRELASRDPDAALAAAARAVSDWSGGTRLGDTIGEFVDTWGRRGMARGAIVVILSDGWDRGDPGILGRHMARLARLAHRVVWVNPLKATPGFAPLAGGMAAALPHVDAFVEGHSLASLEHLVRVVADEVGAGPGAAPVRDARGGAVKEILADVERWLADGRSVALGTVVGIDGSGPRDPGAVMAVNDLGEVAGSVSGGCVEGAVVQEALAVLGGAPPHVVTYGVSDEQAFSVGLTCGGTIHVFVERLDW